MKMMFFATLTILLIITLGCTSVTNCPEVKLKSPIDAWNKQIPEEQLKSNVDYGGWQYVTIAINEFDITSVLLCRIGEKSGQNVNYCYTDKLIKLKEVDSSGNIIGEKRIGLIFNKENQLMGSYCG